MSERNIERQEVLPVFGTGDEQLDRYQRLETIGEIEGFLPTSPAEQVEVIGLESVINRPGGAAIHLAEVAKRQHKTGMEDPNRTTRKITRLYVDWAVDATQRSKALGRLSEAISLDHDINPTLRFSRLDDVIESNTPGLLAFLRWYDLSVMRETGSITAVGYDPQKVDYSPDNPGIMHYLNEALEDWQVHQVRRKLPQAQDHEGLRSSFWAERLTEIVNHYPMLRPIAQEGLDKIYARTG